MHAIDYQPNISGFPFGFEVVSVERGGGRLFSCFTRFRSDRKNLQHNFLEVGVNAIRDCLILSECVPVATRMLFSPA